MILALRARALRARALRPNALTGKSAFVSLTEMRKDDISRIKAMNRFIARHA
jgi:hypothetical protein